MEQQTNYTNNISVMQVAESIEYTRYRKLSKFFAVISVVLVIELALLLFILNWRDDLYHTLEVSIILGVMFGSAFIMSISSIAINVTKMKTMERGVGTLPIYKVVFNEIHKSRWSNGVRFVVEIPDGSGTTVKTRDMFSSNKPATLTKSRTYIPTLYVDDFRGKEVLIMYNSNKNKVYVLGLADQFSLPIDTI